MEHFVKIRREVFSSEFQINLMKNDIIDRVFYQSIGAMSWNIIIGMIAIVINNVLRLPQIPIPANFTIAITGTLLFLHIVIARWTAKSLPKEHEGKTLITTKAYALVRHPMYASTMFLFNIAIAVLLRSIPYAIALIPIWLIWLHTIKKEEEWCTANFNREYALYQQRTPKIIPTWSSIKRSFSKNASP